MAYYIVAGMGRSGIAAARLILETGDSVILFDENEKADTEAAALKIFDGLETDEIDDGQAEDDAAAAGGDDVGSDSLAEEDNDDEALLEFALGELSQEQIDRALACVISPGISIHRPWVKALRDANVPVISEIELAWECSAGRLAAITGTNGKTTTTTLTGELFATVDQEVYTLGNIGIPYTGEALKMSDDAVTALEVSSFQLETISEFRPHVSAILNITEDHLNRHHTMEEYIRVKERIVENMTGDDLCVLNVPTGASAKN